MHVISLALESVKVERQLVCLIEREINLTSDPASTTKHTNVFSP